MIGACLTVALVATVAVVLQASSVGATPVGDEFVVAAGAPTPTLSDMDSNGTGTTVVAWTVSNDGTNNRSVYARRIGADGPIGDPILVNDDGAEYQSWVRIAVDDDGGFIAVWTAYFGYSEANDHGYDIVARRFDMAGDPVGTSFVVNTNRADGQTYADVAVAGDGSFTVVWQSDVLTTTDIQAQRFDASGSAVGGEFTVTPPSYDNEYHPRADMSPAGELIVTWTAQYSGDPWGPTIGEGRRFSSTGVASGADFVLTSGESNNLVTDVAMEDDGDFVATWRRTGGTGGGYAVLARQFLSSGAPKAAELLVKQSGSGVGEVQGARVDVTPDGRFVVAWSEYAPDITSYHDSRARRYLADGSAHGGEFPLNRWSLHGYAPIVAMDDDGDFTAVWQERPPSRVLEIRGQHFSWALGEVCDLRDNDGNGSVDEGFPTDTYWRDLDNDGYGDADGTRDACMQPPGYVTNDDDRDDNDATVYPDAPEVCDGKDNDQDDTVDEGVATTYHRDADGDGYGDPSATAAACSTPVGYVTNGTDVDDSDETIHPGAPELCDGKDNDQDGTIDEEVPMTYYADTDGDGSGDASSTQQACSRPVGHADSGDDADDNDATIYPGAPELDDGKDNDQDETIDEGLDADSDGYTPVHGGDADDDDPTVFPGASEVCDGKDNDQDGTVDEGVKTTYYGDTDGDGYGDPSSATAACSQPVGYVTNGSDVDDSDDSIHPGAPEVCDGKDNDQDGTVDEGVKTTYHRDVDGDGYGDADVTSTACSTPSGYVANGDDADDNDATIHPGVQELCDGKDNDQDGQTDEGDICAAADADGDGLPDERDPDVVADAILAIQTSSFSSGGNRNAALSRLEFIEALITSGDHTAAIAELTDLRKRVDGCNEGRRAKPDKNDWITDCEDQLTVRRLIDALIANLEAEINSAA